LSFSTRNGEWAAFNTGLVGKRYEEIIAVYQPSPKDKSTMWELVGFYKPTDNMLRNFTQIPERAKYINGIEDMCYNMYVDDADDPEIELNHILYERFDRLPESIQRDFCGSRFEEYRKSKSRSLILELEKRNGKRLESIFRDALRVSILRAKWNNRTGVPMYHVAEGETTILLPLALEQARRDFYGEDETGKDAGYDLALAMKRLDVPDGETVRQRYVAKTTFPLNVAYTNARLVNRPDSEWLNPGEIDNMGEDE
jgi:hypothetical protein